MKSIPTHIRAGVPALLAAAGLPLVVSAGVNSWTGSGPQGGDVRDVEYDRSGDTVYATTPAGLYQSTNNGTSWTIVNSTIGSTPFATDPNNADILYFVNFDGPLQRSNDAGETITPVDNWIGGVSTAVDVGGINSSVIYAGTTSDGVVRSTDGGASWHLAQGVTDPSSLPKILGEFATVDGIFVDPTDASIAYATYSAFALGIYRTRDGGTHWTKRTTGLTSLGVASIAIDPNNTMNIYAATDAGAFYSTDQGDTWHEGTGSAAATTIAIDPHDPTKLYAGTFGGGMFASTDSGHTWHASNTGLSLSAIRAVAVHPTDDVTVLAATSEGVSRSTNAASSWADSDSGIVASDVVALAADPQLTGTLFASTTGVHKSARAGSSWAELTDVSASSILIDPTSSAVVYTAGIGVQKSTDGGVNWVSVLSGPTTDVLAYSAGDASIYALDSKNLTLYRTIDGGTNWTTAGTGIVGSEPQALLVDSADVHGNTLYIGTQADGLQKSTNGGADFGRVASLGADDVTGLAQDPTDASILYAATADGVFRSSDGGDTWAATGAADVVGAITVVPDAPEILYGTNATGPGVLRSLDSGASWAPIPVNSALTGTVHQTVLDAVVRNRVYAGTSIHGVQVIDLAHDLQVAIAGPNSVGIDADFDYVTTITNSGPGDAPRVNLTQSLPTDKSSFVSATPDQGDCPAPTGTLLTCNLGTLADGATTTVRITMHSTDRGVLNSGGTVTGFDSDLNSVDNTATAPTAQITQLFDLVADVAAPATVSVGNRVTYTATATNSGPNDASTITIVTTVPPGGTFFSASTALRCNRADAVLTCTGGDLASGESASIDVTYDADQAGALTATMTVSAGSGTDSDPSNDTASATTQASNSGGGGGGGGGGALDPLALFALLALKRHRAGAGRS